jgi:hypothetical protein
MSTGQVDLVSHTDISVNIISVSNPCHFAGFGFETSILEMDTDPTYYRGKF